MCWPVEILVYLYSNPFLIIANTFRCTDRNGNFAVLVKMVLLMIIIIAVFLVYVVWILT